MYSRKLATFLELRKLDIIKAEMLNDLKVSNAKSEKKRPRIIAYMKE